jgi:hypothetical protein
MKNFNGILQKDEILTVEKLMRKQPIVSVCLYLVG